MYITKDYIRGNYSFVSTSIRDLENYLKARGVKIEDYVIMEFGFLYYATHKECFTNEYYKEYCEEQEELYSL